MNSPAAALAWEFWTRNRKRLLAVLSVLLGFVVVYPWLCKWAGLNLDAPDALAEIAKGADQLGRNPPFSHILRILVLLFLACGPLGALVLSLLSMVWMLTFTEFRPKSKNPIVFPTRLFILPISTTQIWFWLMSGGMAALAALYLGWTYLVASPRLPGVFQGHQNFLVWLALLALSQAIHWSLEAWPKLKMLLISAAFFGFMTFPAVCDDVAFFKNYRPHFLFGLLLLAEGVAYVGLSRMRHGRWQSITWNWRRPRASASGATDRPGLNPFRSAAAAQFWFEWHRYAANCLFIVAGLTWVSILIAAVYVTRFGLLWADDLVGIGLLLAVLPPWMFLLLSLGTNRNTPTFHFLRPLTSGEMATAKSKAFALSAVLSWMAVLSALSVFPLLGDFGDHHLRIDNPDFLFRFLFRFRAFLPIIVPGMIYLTWAFAAANYCFSMAGRSWSSKIPMIAFAVFIVGGPMLIYLGQSPDFRQGFFRATPGILVFLVAAKLLLAGWAFRVSLQRRLLARSAMIKYLVVWTVIAVAFIVPTIIVSQHEQASARTIFSLPLAIILLMPMARIGFAPIAISFGRHR